MTFPESSVAASFSWVTKCVQSVVKSASYLQIAILFSEYNRNTQEWRHIASPDLED